MDFEKIFPMPLIPATQEVEEENHELKASLH
jgi:hypothetical protein